MPKDMPLEDFSMLVCTRACFPSLTRMAFQLSTWMAQKCPIQKKLMKKRDKFKWVERRWTSHSSFFSSHPTTATNWTPRLHCTMMGTSDPSICTAPMCWWMSTGDRETQGSSRAWMLLLMMDLAMHCKLSRRPWNCWHLLQYRRSLQELRGFWVVWCACAISQWLQHFHLKRSGKHHPEG